MTVPGDDPSRDWVEVGRVVRALGLRGQLAVGGTEGVLDRAGELTLAAGEGEGDRSTVYRVLTSHPQGRYWAVGLDGVVRREEAERLVGRRVLVPREALGAPDETEWLWADLEGLPVLTTAGSPLGRVTALLPTGGVDVVEVTGERGVVLVPLAPYVKREGDRLVVDPPDGLLDLETERRDEASEEGAERGGA